MSLMRFDPFRDFDRVTGELFRTAARAPRLVAMDGYRDGERYVLHFDLPGVDPESLEVTAEKNVLTVRGQRKELAPEGARYLVSERTGGVFGRRVVLGDGLDLNNVSADYADGVLTVAIPVAEQAKPRKIEIARGDGQKALAGSAQ